MRKLYFILLPLITLFLLNVVKLNAQIEQGTWSLGTDFGFFHTSLSDINFRSTSLSIGVQPGFFIINNLQVGANFGLSLAGRSGGFNQTERSTGFIAGGRVTYMIQATDQLYIPVFSGIDFSTSSNSNMDINNNFSIIRVGAGLEYLVNNRLGVRYNLTFSRFSNTTQNIFQGTVGVFYYW